MKNYHLLLQDIEAWINEQSIPSVWEFSSTNAQKIFATKAKVHFLYFIKGGEDLQKDLEPLKKVSADYKNKVTFAYVDVNEKSNAQVTKFFGIDASMAPMYTLFEVSKIFWNIYHLIARRDTLKPKLIERCFLLSQAIAENMVKF